MRHSTHVAGAVASGVKLDLVDHRGNAGFIDQALEVMDLKVADDTLYASPLLQRDHAFSRRRRHSDR